MSSYHLILEVIPEAASDVDTLNRLYVRSNTGQTVSLCAFAKWSTVPVQPLSISHQSQFPAVTISFNLAQGAALGQPVDAIDAAMRETATLITLQTFFQGTAQALRSPLSSQPYLIAAGLITVYIILGNLYESYILAADHSLHAAVGRRRHALDAHSADRHREKERHTLIT